MLPEARQRVWARLARSRQAKRLRAERPQPDWARLTELRERFGRAPQAPQVLARQALRDAPEVRSRGATAPLLVLMEPQQPDAPARTELARAVRAWKKAQQVTRAQRDEPQQEGLQQALRAEAWYQPELQPPETEAVQRQAQQPWGAAQAGPSARTSPPPRRPPLPRRLENACAPARHDPDRASSSAFSSR